LTIRELLGINLGSEEDSAFEFELKRPRLFGDFALGFRRCHMGFDSLWHVNMAWWMDNVDDGLLVLVSFVCGLNAVTIGFLIDMHSLEFKGVRIGLRRRRREKKEGK
jgi:hypothetical protein